ncbi:unnamed protein product [Caenorhabditis brenneri]
MRKLGKIRDTFQEKIWKGQHLSPNDKSENGSETRVNVHDSDADPESLENENSMDFEEDTGKIMELRKMNEELSSRITELTNFEKKLAVANTQLTKRVTQLETRLKNEKQKTEKMQSKLREDISESKRALTEQVLENSQLELQITKLTNSEKKLRDANTQLTKRVTHLESQLKNEEQRTERMESKHRKEISKIKRALTEQISENAQLETQIAMKNSEIERLNQKYQEILTMNEELKKGQENLTNESDKNRIIEFESLLEEEKQKTIELAQGMIPPLQRLAGGRLNLHLEKEISEIRRTNCRLENENIRLSAQVEQQNLTLKAVFQHFGPLKTTFSSSSTQTSPEELTKNHLSLQKIKDSFSTGKHMKQAKDMIERLISVSNRSEIHEMARYELQQYEGQIQNYLQSVEVNIQNSEQLDLPDFPSLSDRFLKEYWKYCIGADDASEDGLPECLICLVEMIPEEKTMKCENCRKVMHFECVSRWLKEKRSCPQCRRELLDPNEFPPLS